MSPPVRRAGAVAAVLLGLCAVPLRADEFFATRDQNPLLRGFYLPLPSDARLDAGAVFSATLLVSNTLNVENRGSESLHVDGESTVLDLSYDGNLSGRWRYRLGVPLIHDGGGVLDSAIDTWHQLFGFSRGFRPYYPKNQIEYSYSGRASIDMDHSQTGLGDVSADLGWYAADDVRRTVSLWGGIKAPTGSVANLTSDGAWDGALWSHAAMRWAAWQLAGELGAVLPFGDELFEGAAHRPSVFARMAATRVMGSLWSLRAQLDGQSGRVGGSDLRFLGPSLQLTLGADRRIGNRWHLQMGFAEDVAVNTAPDITFFLGIRD
jgi:Protein of unknown function (DUF3187)